MLRKTRKNEDPCVCISGYRFLSTRTAGPNTLSKFVEHDSWYVQLLLVYPEYRFVYLLAQLFFHAGLLYLLCSLGVSR